MFNGIPKCEKCKGMNLTQVYDDGDYTTNEVGDRVFEPDGNMKLECHRCKHITLYTVDPEEQ